MQPVEGPEQRVAVRPHRRRARLGRPDAADPRAWPSAGIGFKTIGEAIYLRNHVLDRLDVAASVTDEATPAQGADLRLRRRRLRRRSRRSPRWRTWPATRPATTPNSSPDGHALGAGRGDRPDPARGRRPMSEYTVQQLLKRNMDIRLDTRLESCVDGHVVLSDGDEFDADTIVWTAGRQAAPDARPHRPPAGRQGPARLHAGPAGRPACEDAWSAGDCAAVPDLTATSRARTTGPSRAARGPPGQDARRQHRRRAARPAAEGLPAQARRLGGQPRPLQGRRPGLRHQAARLPGLVHAPDVPPVPGADAQPQGPGAGRLDAGALLPARGRLARPAAAAAAGVRAGRAARPGARCPAPPARPASPRCRRPAGPAGRRASRALRLHPGDHVPVRHAARLRLAAGLLDEVRQRLRCTRCRPRS